MATPGYLPANRARLLHVSARAVNLIGVNHIVEMMGNQALLLIGWFGGADVEFPVKLHRVAVDDLGAENQGGFNGESALAATGGTGQSDQFRA
jgi:hypothetical protein